MSHSVIGASSCERFWNCPGSIALAQKAPPPRPSFYAAEGTVAHSIGERYLRKLQIVDNAFLGEVFTEEGFGVEVTLDMLEAVCEYVDTIIDDLKGLKRSRLKVEVGFSLTHLDAEAYGTCDAAIHKFDQLSVYDYKHGAGEFVGVLNNKQILYYLLGFFYSLSKGEQREIETLEGIIVQPRCKGSADTVRRAFYDRNDLSDFEDGLRDAIGRVRRGDPTLRAGSWCKFCPAKPICPEIRADVERNAQIDFADVDDDSELISHPVDPTVLKPAQIANLLRHIPRIRDWCDAVESYAFQESDRGVEIPGYMLSPRRSNRKWKDEKAVIDEFEWLYGTSIYVPRKLVTPARLEKLLPKDERAKLQQFWEKPDTGRTLVQVESGREKLLPSAIADFIDLDVD